MEVSGLERDKSLSLNEEEDVYPPMSLLRVMDLSLGGLEGIIPSDNSRVDRLRPEVEVIADR